MKRAERLKQEELGGAKERSAEAAAFFDLDGTLLPLPSLECRLWKELRYRKKIPARNYLNWLGETARLVPRGIAQMVNGNKAYLRGIRAEANDAPVLPMFFPEALQRVRWHAEREHRLAIVSGTLEPLAQHAARLLEMELMSSGVTAAIEVMATRLEIAEGKWTGKIVGEAIFGGAKARAIRSYCAAKNIEPRNCFAYGDRMNDAAMLEAVGMPQAVNPSNDLARAAARRNWPIFRWSSCEGSAGSARKWNEKSREARNSDCAELAKADSESGA